MKKKKIYVGLRWIQRTIYKENNELIPSWTGALHLTIKLTLGSEEHEKPRFSFGHDLLFKLEVIYSSWPLHLLYLLRLFFISPWLTDTLGQHLLRAFLCIRFNTICQREWQHICMAHSEEMLAMIKYAKGQVQRAAQVLGQWTWRASEKDCIGTSMFGLSLKVYVMFPRQKRQKEKPLQNANLCLLPNPDKETKMRKDKHDYQFTIAMCCRILF